MRKLSKRKPGIYVITDKLLATSVHIFKDGSGPSVLIELTAQDLVRLAKEASRRPKSLRNYKGGRFIHLSPEISFYLERE